MLRSLIITTRNRRGPIALIRTCLTVKERQSSQKATVGLNTPPLTKAVPRVTMKVPKGYIEERLLALERAATHTVFKQRLLLPI